MEKEIEPGADTGPEAAPEQPAAELEQPAAAPAKPPARAAQAAPERGEERRAPREREAGDSQDRQRRRGGGGFGRGRRRPCVMCVDSMAYVDYKDFNFLRRFISDRGRIETRRKTGTCAKHQRALAQAIKRARHLALLPYTADHLRTGATPLR